MAKISKSLFPKASNPLATLKAKILKTYIPVAKETWDAMSSKNKSFYEDLAEANSFDSPGKAFYLALCLLFEVAHGKDL